MYSKADCCIFETGEGNKAVWNRGGEDDSYGKLGVGNKELRLKIYIISSYFITSTVPMPKNKRT